MMPAPATALDVIKDVEQTTQFDVPRAWQWPTVDLDAQPRVIAEARLALRYQEPPTLPVLHAVLEGLQRL